MPTGDRDPPVYRDPATGVLLPPVTVSPQPVPPSQQPPFEPPTGFKSAEFYAQFAPMLGSWFLAYAVNQHWFSQALSEQASPALTGAIIGIGTAFTGWLSKTYQEVREKRKQQQMEVAAKARGINVNTTIPGGS